MMHNSLHQFPALSLRLHQPSLQFIAEGRELVQSGEMEIQNPGDTFLYEYGRLHGWSEQGAQLSNHVYFSRTGVDGRVGKWI